MKKKLKVLHLEDEAADAELVSRILKKESIGAEILVVDNKGDYIKALVEFGPDIILSDHKLIAFDSAEALIIFRQSGMKIPFILVTGAISEEYAVSVIKAGAHDYILKEHLDKLPAAIFNSIETIKSGIDLEISKARNITEKTNAILLAQEQERSQVTYELLENINQILAASNLYIDCAISEAGKRLQFMQNSKKYILMAIDEIKNLSRVIIAPVTGEIGLIESLKNWIALKQLPDGMHFNTIWENFNDHGVSDTLQLAIYRIVQEQLNNTLKHASAKNVYISLVQTNDSVELTIRDDGVGFDTVKKTAGLGLKNIYTRVEIHNGKMLLNSEPGKSCMLTIIFPL